MRLNVHRLGPDSPSVLLLHGLSSAGPVWAQIGAMFEAVGYSSIAPDLRGHGQSAHPGEYSLDGYAGDVIETCPGPWRLVIGHSLGGATAVRAASLKPDFASAYLLIDPAIDFDPIAAETVRVALVADVTEPPTIEELVAERPKWSKEDAERKRDALLATSVDVMNRSFADNRDWGLGAELSRIPVPVHLLGAEEEPLYTSAAFARHSENAPNLTFEQVPGTGHSIHRDDPATVIARALGLLSPELRATHSFPSGEGGSAPRR
ncbi:MAG: alpha/beta hydrolase [Acidimicrobiia bacterium]